MLNSATILNSELCSLLYTKHRLESVGSLLDKSTGLSKWFRVLIVASIRKGIQLQKALVQNKKRFGSVCCQHCKRPFRHPRKPEIDFSPEINGAKVKVSELQSNFCIVSFINYLYKVST